ncbi:serine/threonine-protein kinase fused [Pelomyxa schiedti]|nr:serine/threonine-protein kinase fused [Pelomyxa schiedti]
MFAKLGCILTAVGALAALWAVIVLRIEHKFLDSTEDGVTLNGWAKELYDDGSVYEGLWRQGTWTRGSWHHRARDGSIVAYEGEWAWAGAGVGARGHQLNGWGAKRVMPAGTPFTYGKGVMAYEGQWLRGNIHGNGTQMSEGGEIYIGEFKNGKRSGNGRALFADGGSYIGEWRDNMFHGHGARRLATGDTYIGKWDRGLEQDKKNWKVCRGENPGTKLQEADRLLDITHGLNKEALQIDRNILRMELTIFRLRLGFVVVSGLAIALFFIVFYFKTKVSKLIKELADNKERIKQLSETNDYLQQQLEEEKKNAQQKLQEEKRFAQHILQHVQGAWIQRLPQGNEKELEVTFLNHTFQDFFCCSCPLEKVVKISIQSRFGVGACHQEVYVVKRASGKYIEELLSPMFTLSQWHTSNLAPYPILVKIKPIPTMMRSDFITLSPIGRGTYGWVYQCEHKGTKELLAVKELHGILQPDYYLERFQHEAETIAALEHPNIVKFIGTCPPATELWIVSELLGGNLRDLITKKKKLNLEEAAAIAWGIAKGMEAIHRHNYMHRALSSKNIVFDSCGIPKICDFGVAQKTHNMAHMPGTPFYMAPQMQTHHYTIAGDMWQFGILMSEMICGQVEDKTHLRKDTRSLEEQKSILSRSAKDEVDRLRNDPSFSQRKQGASSLAEYLGRRDTCLKQVAVELASTSKSCPKASQVLNSVVEWCLSVVEKERPPFNAIVQLLYSCLSLYYCESGSLHPQYDLTSASSGWQTPLCETDITARISACYSSLSPLTRRE